MTIGVMEVNLVDARGLTKSDFLTKIDPYVVIKYRSQEHKSTIANGEGSNPKWNEKFSFRVEYPGADEQPTLVLKIMDHDTFSSDDYIGQTTIYLKEVLELGVENGTSELRTQKYRVVDRTQSYCGDIRVGVTFTPKVYNNLTLIPTDLFASPSYYFRPYAETETYAQEFGGWKENQW